MSTTLPLEVLQSAAYRALVGQVRHERELQRSAVGRDLDAARKEYAKAEARRTRARDDAAAALQAAAATHAQALAAYHQTEFRAHSEAAPAKIHVAQLERQLHQLADPRIARALDHLSAWRDLLNAATPTEDRPAARVQHDLRAALDAHHAIRALAGIADVDAPAVIARTLAAAGAPPLDD